jgi:hypothetical protein
VKKGEVAADRHHHTYRVCNGFIDKRVCRKPRNIWKYNVKINMKENMDWIQLAVVNTIMKLNTPPCEQKLSTSWAS